MMLKFNNLIDQLHVFIRYLWNIQTLAAGRLKFKQDYGTSEMISIWHLVDEIYQL